MVRLTLSLLALLCMAPCVAQAGSWRRPVDGSLLRGFDLRADPYARGQHRGIDLRAAPGSRVRSACGGRTTFAGRVPRGGMTVSVRCGALIATYQQLGSSSVRGGQVVAPGARVGAVGRSRDPRAPEPHVHLGVRYAASGRYVDPLSLLSGDRRAPPPPLAPAPRRTPRGSPVRPAPSPLPRSAPRVTVPLGRAPEPALPRSAPLGRAPAPASQAGRARAPASPRGAPPGPPAPGRSAADQPDRPPGVPLVAWLGLASVGLALPVGGMLTLRRRGRHAPRDTAVATR